MALRFSDIFGSGDKEGKSDTSTGQDADANFSASNSGVTAASESYSRDEDRNEDHDRTSVDSGELSLSSDVAAGNMFEDVSGLSNSSNQRDTARDGEGSNDTGENSSTSATSENSDRSAKADSDTETDQRADANTNSSNDGVRAETESDSRDEDGEVSYDRTSLDTGETDVSFNLELDNMIDSMSDLSNSLDDAAIFD
ncbi:MAG: hypothetical protein M3Q08_15175 [Pseudomonadota bacterium]|nr:hypothetical protein [Pseudomonadota bacterium]